MDQEVADRPPTGDGIAGPLLKAIGQPPKAFTLSELDASGPLSRSAIYREIRDGRLIARKAGKSTIVLAEDWDAYLRALPRMNVDVTVTEPVGPREARAKRQVITA
jgi:hypothetical protein